MPTRTAFVSILCLMAPLADGATHESVTFGTVTPRVGDRVDQQVSVTLRLDASVRRGAEVLESSKIDKTTAHDRRVTTTEVAGGRRTGVEIVYGDATEKAIAGKTYHCRRDGEALRVTDAAGAIPPLAEFEVVARHMELLGRPNPLAAFLRGKTVAVGETIDVPAKVAAELLGAKRFGHTERFRLTLSRVDQADGGAHARFAADISVAASDGTQTRMEIGGPMVIDAATSRLVTTELLGPIAMHQARNDPGGRLQVSATGRFSVSMRSTTRESLVAENRDPWRLRF